MQTQAKKDLLERLDANQYSREEVVVLTIPLSLPYPIQNNGYERVNGDFEYQGEYYKLVKQKLENDTLFLVCIKDVEAKKIEVAMTDYSKLANNVPAGSKQALNFLGKLYKDFNTSEFVKLYKSRALYRTVFYAKTDLNLPVNVYPVDSPPPRQVS